MAAAAILSVFNTALLSQCGLQQPKSHAPCRGFYVEVAKFIMQECCRDDFLPFATSESTVSSPELELEK